MTQNDVYKVIDECMVCFHKLTPEFIDTTSRDLEHENIHMQLNQMNGFHVSIFWQILSSDE